MGVNLDLEPFAAHDQPFERPIIIAGPCSAESEEQVMSTAKKLAQNIPDVQTVVLNTGHAVGVERPEEVNSLIVNFFEQP